jgi:hypothetical protein
MCIVWIRYGVVPGSELREKKERQGGETELHQHVGASCEEWEVEIEVFGVEHPFIILSQVVRTCVLRRGGRTYNRYR